MMFWLLGPLLCLWPKHRYGARVGMAEALIGHVFRLLPDGQEKREFAAFMVESWMGRRFAARKFGLGVMNGEDGRGADTNR